MLYDRARLIGHQRERARAVDRLSADLEIVDLMITRGNEFLDYVLMLRKEIDDNRARDKLNGFEDEFCALIHDTLHDARGRLEMELADLGVSAPAEPTRESDDSTGKAA